MTRDPDHIWWTADEIAAAALPDLPASKRGVNTLAERLGWRRDPERSRRRAGRGGGWEYHWKLFPLSAQKKLLAEAEPPSDAAPEKSREQVWAEFEELPDTAKDKAKARLRILSSVEALEGAGRSRSDAVADVATMEHVGVRTIWGWFGMVEGVAREDRLPHLAPRHRQAARSDRKQECDPDFKAALFGDYLRLAGPSFTSSYRRATKIAKAEGWKTLPERTMRRRLDAEVSRTTQIYLRKGLDALKGLYPAQTRDKTALHALEAVNADYHKFDVFVDWPLGHNEFEIVRPQMVAFQDIYSGRILSWRLSRNPNKSDVGLALGDMIREFGIPEHMLLDNGREFANKFLTGQAQTRHRFKIKDDDIPGVLKTLGIDIHWATPYHGQAKPIERAFKDLCDTVAKDPRFEGAYTGNRPEAKPENYGSRAIPLDQFLQVLAEGIEEHNTRAGRRSATAAGRSLHETFEASYARAPIRKATPEQARLWLMGAEGIRADAKTGLLRFMKNEYWSPWMSTLAGQRVVARFDPENLTEPLHIYALDGAYLGQAECRDAGGFFDLEEARQLAQAKAAWRKAERAAAAAVERMKVTEISSRLDAASSTPSAPAEAKVVRPIFRSAVPAEPQPRPEEEAEIASIQERLRNRDMSARTPAQEPDDERIRFRWAVELRRRIEAGEPVGQTERTKLASYEDTAEFRGQHRLYQKFGEAMLSR